MNSVSHEKRKAAAEALRRQDWEPARALLQELIAAGVVEAEVWLALARACDNLGDHAGRAEAVDGALAADPRGVSTLVAKADLLCQLGDKRAAAAFYAAALSHMPNFAKLPAAQQGDLLRAKAAQERQAGEFEDYICANLTQQGLLGADAPPRFVLALDMLLGRRRRYVQQPRHFFFPGFPDAPFHPREAFPWIGDIEAQSDAIRSELLEAMGEGGHFRPYVSRDRDRPFSNQAGLAGNDDWSACFLVKDGAPTLNARTCPRTMQTLAVAPSPDIPMRTPHILFSKLAAGAHIPPHTGMLNVRLICHLALIVPPLCALRVGSEVRTWEEGKCWVFDDTIEHEAWNKSDRDRYVLIFDVWRPELSPEERHAVAALCAAVDAYSGDKSSWDA
jgi:aspartyl/asparaginyl beta-hydroxylase (cupin superfamily)